MDTRIYKVAVKAVDDNGVARGVKEKLVRAGTPAQAIRHVAKGMVDASVASQDDIARLAGAGAKVEDASAD